MTAENEHSVTLTDDQVEAWARREYEQYVGCLIHTNTALCNGIYGTQDIWFPDRVTLRILANDSDLKRWMDDHLDPWYAVELVIASAASQAALDAQDADIGYVYGPSYHPSGRYDKPEWKVRMINA